MSQSLTSNDAAVAQPSPAAASSAGGQKPGMIGVLMRSVPSFLTFCLLGVVFWFGSRNHWQLPKFAALLGEVPEAVDDWCTEHAVPASICVQCKPELFVRAKPTGFCKKHGVAECVHCHPELAEVTEKPSLPKYDTVAAINLVERPKNNSLSTLHQSLVQFSSREAVDRAGVDIDLAIEHPMTEAVTANGEILFDPTRVAHLSVRLPGRVVLVCKFIGDPVEAGDVLALIDATEVGQAKASLAQSLVQLRLRRSTFERLQGAGKAVTGRSVSEAEAAMQESEVAMNSAKQSLGNFGFSLPEGLESGNPDEIADRLRFLGIPEAIVKQLPAGTTTANLIPLRAPYPGVVMETEVVAGEVVDSSKPLFVVADPTRLVLNLAVRSEDVRYVSLGLPVEFQPDATAAQAKGKVAWISPTVNEQTRTLLVRVTLHESTANLRDHTFGSGRVILRHEPNSVVVPKESIQSTADAFFVFVRDKHYFEENAPKLFHVRQVRIGAKDDRYVELLAGVLPGEVVAAKGSNVLLAQLLKSNLGAGCGCCPH